MGEKRGAIFYTFHPDAIITHLKYASSFFSLSRIFDCFALFGGPVAPPLRSPIPAQICDYGGPKLTPGHHLWVVL